MLIGRFFLIIPVLAIGGSLVRKQTVPVTAGTFPTDSPLFGGLVAGVVLIVAGLTFFPALALGPIVEQLEPVTAPLDASAVARNRCATQRPRPLRAVPPPVAVRRRHRPARLPSTRSSSSTRGCWPGTR